MDETPADAFGVLGNDTRVAILEALAEATEPGYGQQAVRFSDIRERVGVDDSGRLNYHLDKLRGTFVRRTDEGYRLRYAGWKVLRVIRAGAFHERPEREFDAPGSCYACGAASLRARTADEWVGIRCGDCETLHTAHPLPPTTVQEQEPDHVLRALDADVRRRAALVADGFCPECFDEVTVRIRDREDVPDAWDIEVVPQFRCRRCTYWFHPTFGLLALEHPTVEKSLERQGVDPSAPYWTLPVCVSPEHTAIDSREPWRIVLEVSTEGDGPRVVFDGEASIRDVRTNERSH